MILLSQCYAQMKISFPGLIFAQYKSIKLLLLLLDIGIFLSPKNFSSVRIS